MMMMMMIVVEMWQLLLLSALLTLMNVEHAASARRARLRAVSSRVHATQTLAVLHYASQNRAYRSMGN